jgi:thioesterase domain-containing protein
MENEGASAVLPSTLVMAPGMFGPRGFERHLQGILDGSWKVRMIEYPPQESVGVGAAAFEAVVVDTVRQLAAVDAAESLYLVGSSFGSHVLVEAASRIAATGRRIAFLGLIFTFAEPGENEWKPPPVGDWVMRNSRNGLGGLLKQIARRRHLLVKSLLLRGAFATTEPSRGQFNRLAAGILGRLGFKRTAQQFRWSTQGVLRVRSMLAFRAARYPGRVWLLRPDELRGSTQPDDCGWSALCGELRIERLPVSSADFWSRVNWPSIIARLLAALENERKAVPGPGCV